MSRPASGPLGLAFLASFASIASAQPPRGGDSFVVNATSDAAPIVAGDSVRAIDAPAGCSDVIVSIEPASEVSFSIHRHDGELLSEARLGVGRSAARVCRDRPEPLVVAVHARRPGVLAIDVAAVADGATTLDDGTRTPASRPTPTRSDVSAPARVSAAVGRLRDEGWELLEPIRVFVAPSGTSVAMPAAHGACRIFVVAVEGGDAVVGGGRVEPDRAREWVACGDAGEAVEVRPVSGAVRVAIGFVGSSRFGFDERGLDRARIVASLSTRGLDVIRELDVLAAPGVDASFVVTAAPNRCLAVASPSRSLRSLALVDASGRTVALSSSRMPSVFHCAGDESSALRAVATGGVANASIRLLVAEDRRP